jgi:hypothetical protein
MFDNGVAEYDIERAVRELAEVGGVALASLDVLMHRWLGIQIGQHDVNVGAAGPAALLPELIRPADIEDSDGPLVLSAQSVDEGSEGFKAPAAPRIRE